MMIRMHQALERRRNGLQAGDEGFGLILVIGFTMVILGLLLVASTVAINSLRSSSSHATFEQALAVAEAGIDQALARLQVDTTYNPCACSLTATDLANETSERAAAKTKLLAYAATASNVQTTNQGQFVAIRPTGAQKVYAMSWVPSKATVGAKTRLIKAEYLFSPYKPGNAFAAEGDVDFTGGSVTIEAAPGSSAGQLTPVHTNGSITGNATSISIAGATTASGSYGLPAGANVGAGSAGGAPLETVPAIDPAQIYTSTTDATLTGAWYDLCPGGVVRSKQLVRTSTALPCDSATTTQLATSVTTSVTPGYRGWTWAQVAGRDIWTMGLADSPYSGIYYVYQGDALVNGGTTGSVGTNAWNATVMAEALNGGDTTNSSNCNKKGGKITTHNTDITAKYPGTVLIAGSDLDITGSSNHMGMGMFAATDQVYLSSSSATYLTGAVVASDTCANGGSPSSMQGVTLDFDTTFESPIKSVIRTTQWIEYLAA